LAYPDRKGVPVVIHYSRGAVRKTTIRSFCERDLRLAQHRCCTRTEKLRSVFPCVLCDATTVEGTKTRGSSDREHVSICRRGPFCSSRNFYQRAPEPFCPRSSSRKGHNPVTCKVGRALPRVRLLSSCRISGSYSQWERRRTPGPSFAERSLVL
jgi:hypothetical protein